MHIKYCDSILNLSKYALRRYYPIILVQFCFFWWIWCAGGRSVFFWRKLSYIVARLVVYSPAICLADYWPNYYT